MTWHFYDPLTGIFSGKSYSGGAEHLTENTPKGLSSFCGSVDWRSECVDLVAGNLVACATTGQLDDAAAQAFRRVSLQEQINALEQQQARPLRELAVAQLLGRPTPQDAADRVHAIYMQIEEHRKSA